MNDVQTISYGYVNAHIKIWIRNLTRKQFYILKNYVTLFFENEVQKKPTFHYLFDEMFEQNKKYNEKRVIKGEIISSITLLFYSY